MRYVLWFLVFGSPLWGPIAIRLLINALSRGGSDGDE